MSEAIRRVPELAPADAMIEFLRRHVPFDRMSEDVLHRLAANVQVVSYSRDSAIVAPDHGPVTHLYIVQQGLVGSRPDQARADPDRTLGPGELFPVGALSAGGSTTRVFSALRDTVCLLLSREEFLQLRKISPEFERFCTHAITETLRQSLESLYGQYRLRANEQQTLSRTLGELVRQAPVSCHASTTLRDAAQRMADAKVRTIVVTDDGGAPVGMLTLVDLLRRVLLPEKPLSTTVAETMTAPVVTLPTSASASEALYVMADRGIRQVVVVGTHGPVGVINERDLFALQRISMRQVIEGLHAARSIADLKHAADDIRGLTRNLLAQGVVAEPLTRTVAALNDALTRRVIALDLEAHDVVDTAFCWLALGSEGRGEQTFASDQDNALIFTADDTRDAAQRRQKLLPFARAVNEHLAELGFPLCNGSVMASNPDLCLSTEEWKAKFLAWIREPTPEALLNANIVFDFRALSGDTLLVDSLRAWLFAYTGANPAFLRLMVQNALASDAPLGLLRTFAVDDDREPKGTVDLKARGTRIFVDCARVFALALGIAETGTAARLRIAGERLRVDARHVDAAVESFHFLQLLRLRQQDLAGTQGAADGANRIDPYALHEVDQRMLKEAFRQARQLQERLRMSYRL